LPTYRLDIEYNGSEWHGWQIQPDHPTIQGAIEAALQTALRKPVSIVGSGRTDAGVHASGQVAHFKVPEEIDPVRLMGSLNGILPDSVAVRFVQQVPESFHARFDATSRQYRYQISTIPTALDAHLRWFVRPAPDFEAMERAAQYFLGAHDFTSFCKVISETENKVCVIDKASWTLSEGNHGRYDFVIRADRFLHGMVRAIVGTLIEVGQGKRDEHAIPGLIAAQDRTRAGFAAPARGLILERVEY